MDNLDTKKSSVSAKNKKNSLARYDYHDVIGLIYTIILTVGLGIGMSATIVWQYYKTSAGDKATLIGLFDSLVDRMQFRFNTAYIFAVLLLWCAVGFVLATALLKVAKNFQKVVYAPKEFTRMHRIYIICFGAAALSVVLAFIMSFIFPVEMMFINAIPRDVNFFLALLFVLIAIIAAAVATAIVSAPFMFVGHMIGQNPAKKILCIVIAVFAALTNLPAFICSVFCMMFVKKSANKEDACRCWIYPSLMSTILVAPVLAFLFLKVSEYAYTNTSQLLLIILPIVVGILTLLLVPTFFFNYYFFKMYLPATDVNYYNVASSSVLGVSEDSIYDNEEEKAKAE